MVALTEASEANTHGFSVGDDSAKHATVPSLVSEGMPHFRSLYAACGSIPIY
jgi:hypothetical protein